MALTTADYKVADLDQGALREHIGVALQEPVLFSGTIRDNIRYGRPDASEEEVVAAAQAAQADEFITALPDGYDSRLGQRGVNVSGGQKQRLAIARALSIDHPNLAVIVVSESTDGQLVLTAMRAGVREFLTKPVQRTQLVHLLERYATDSADRSALVVDDKPENRELLDRLVQHRVGDLQADPLGALQLDFLDDQRFEQLVAEHVRRRQLHRRIRSCGAFDDDRGLVAQLALQHHAVVDDGGNAIDKFARLGEFRRQCRRGDGQHPYDTRASA